MRGAVYIDAFNLYHAIDDLNLNYLKWCNLWRLSESIMKGHAKPLVKVVWCTAYRSGNTGAKARHRALKLALDHCGVQCEFGHEVMEPAGCRACGANWDIPREKATDINLALAAFQDAVDNVYDAAFIVTADTDQAATFSFIKKRFPTKRLYTVTPPGRQPSKHLTAIADGKISISERMLDSAVLPFLVGQGAGAVTRPVEYDPPPGYVHPDDRP
ncbi:MAG: NYN domain-containing protein [Sphingopyxis sp.]|uniref:NYN domain-containing protein n=1 Tax=Sphingopyxis sp. TaxID=1908224 RepID=UPI003D6D0728